jgi:bacteriorhodopsin
MLYLAVMCVCWQLVLEAVTNGTKRWQLIFCCSVVMLLCSELVGAKGWIEKQKHAKKEDKYLI